MRNKWAEPIAIRGQIRITVDAGFMHHLVVLATQPTA